VSEELFARGGARFAFAGQAGTAQHVDRGAAGLTIPVSSRLQGAIPLARAAQGARHNAGHHRGAPDRLVHGNVDVRQSADPSHDERVLWEKCRWRHVHYFIRQRRKDQRHLVLVPPVVDGNALERAVAPLFVNDSTS
jgi:hypothetical protein